MFEKNNITEKERKAYSEVHLILETLGREYKDKVPEEILNFIYEEADKVYLKKIDDNTGIENRNLLKETLTIFSYLNLKYWCANEAEKERLKYIFLEKNKK